MKGFTLLAVLAALVVGYIARAPEAQLRAVAYASQSSSQAALLRTINAKLSRVQVQTAENQASLATISQTLGISASGLDNGVLFSDVRRICRAVTTFGAGC